MDASAWYQRFRAAAATRPSIDFSPPCPEPARVRKHLARSLAHFQLGESGDGRHLLAKASRAFPEAEQPAMLECLRLFLAEEQEHARLLGRLCRRMGGEPIDRHWTHAVFARVRRAGGFDLELTILACAELVGISYYRLIGQVTVDPVLKAACDLILNDEARHLELHVDLARKRCSSRGESAYRVYAARLALLHRVAAACAYVDHAPCLSALGVRATSFFAQARRDRELFAFALGPAAVTHAAPLLR
jgi:hypothetical protein